MSAEEDYSGLFENSHKQKPTHSQIVKEVINWFYGPDAGKFSKEWSKRLLRPRPRLTQALSTSTPEYVTYDTASYPVHGPSARIPYHVIILGGVLILAVFYLLLFLVINRLRCCKKNQQRTAGRRNRETRREASGLYHIEGDVLGSGNVLSLPKLGQADDSPPPSYEDAMIACGYSPQQLAEAKTNQATPSNVNGDDVELN